MRFFEPWPTAAACLLSLALVTSAAQTQTRYALEDDADKKPWQEAEIKLPPPPDPANLLEFDAGAGATQTFAVDSKSITVGPDGVVRYTVVATSRSGARSVSHEGIRCSSFERRAYAFGQKDGSWSPSRNSEWKRIPPAVRNGYAQALAQDYFCMDNDQVGNAAEIVERIRKKQVLNPRIQY